MLIRYGKEEGIDVVCIVRKEEQIKLLMDMGAAHVINYSDEKWKDQLKEKCTQLNARLGFDSIGGSITGEILAQMPKGSEIQVYGSLSGQPVGAVGISDLVFLEKKKYTITRKN